MKESAKNYVWIALALVILLAWSKLSDMFFGENQKDIADSIGQQQAIEKANEFLVNDGLVYTLSVAEISEIAQNIYNSLGFFNDNETLLFTNVNRIKTKDDLKLVNIYFTELYGSDLVVYVNSYLNQDERLKFNNIINSLS